MRWQITRMPELTLESFECGANLDRQGCARWASNMPTKVLPKQFFIVIKDKIKIRFATCLNPLLIHLCSEFSFSELHQGNGFQIQPILIRRVNGRRSSKCIQWMATSQQTNNNAMILIFFQLRMSFNCELCSKFFRCLIQQSSTFYEFIVTYQLMTEIHR